MTSWTSVAKQGIESVFPKRSDGPEEGQLNSCRGLSTGIAEIWWRAWRLELGTIEHGFMKHFKPKHRLSRGQSRNAMGVRFKTSTRILCHVQLST